MTGSTSRVSKDYGPGEYQNLEKMTIGVDVREDSTARLTYPLQCKSQMRDKDGDDGVSDCACHIEAATRIIPVDILLATLNGGCGERPLFSLDRTTPVSESSCPSLHVQHPAG